jgi:hypothetical protein
MPVLANVISLFHTLVVLFVIFGTFSQNPAILILHITFLCCLLVHWAGNSAMCSLSVMEASLRGVKNTKTFTHQFVSPLYSIPESSWNQIVTGITIFLLILSVNNLRNNKKFIKALECTGETGSVYDKIICIFESMKM